MKVMNVHALFPAVPDDLLSVANFIQVVRSLSPTMPIRYVLAANCHIGGASLYGIDSAGPP